MYNQKSSGPGIVHRLVGGTSWGIGICASDSSTPHFYQGRVCKSEIFIRKEKCICASVFSGAAQLSGTDHHLHKVVSEAHTGRALGNHSCPSPIIRDEVRTRPSGQPQQGTVAVGLDVQSRLLDTLIK